MTDRGAVLVTGVSKGIGRAIAEDMTARGHPVIGLSRGAPDWDFAGEFHAVDLTDAAATAAVLKTIAGRHRVLRVVNNAGAVRVAPAESAPLSDLDSMVALNIRALAQCSQAFIPAMQAAGFGRIVMLGSRAAQGKEGRMFYGATKGAVASMTRSMALELGPCNITVNCIAPGPIDTELFAENNPVGSPARCKIEAGIAVGRIGRPAEVAAAARYFLSEEAGFTTGQTLYVCGGLSI